MGYNSKLQITALGIENFKSFSKVVNFPIRPITLLFGPNSSGKSSFLKSILMLKQTFDNGNFDLLCPNGPLINLGNYQEFVSNHDINKQITFNFQISIKNLQQKIGIDFNQEDNRKKSFLIENLAFIFDKYKTLTASLSYSYINPKELIKLTSIRFYLGDDKTLLIGQNVGNHEYGAYSDFKHSFWKLYWETFDKPNNNHYHINELRDWAKDWDGEEGFYQDWADEIFEVLESEPSGYEQSLKLYGLLLKHSDIEFMGRFIQITGDNNNFEDIINDDHFYCGPISILLLFNGAIRNFFQNFSYIGPLRAPPKRYYVFDNSNNKPSLSLDADVMPYRLFNDPRLLQDVNNELKRLGMLYEIRISKFINQNLNIESDILFSLDLFHIHAERYDNLSDVGFGFCQILPIISRCCLASNRRNIDKRHAQTETILIEQPELHLHPAMQTELGDLFIKAAQIDKKEFEIKDISLDPDEEILRDIEESASPAIRNSIFIETHSEHIILRILRRIRETSEGENDKTSPIFPNDVAVLYVKPNHNGSQVVHIQITEDGDFEFDWPGGFFEERDGELFF